ncbi:ATP-dependent endonuclease [Mitsuaria sp. 7]|uniref:ATP-dependent nuclease n=1 Tax=Mitsuaria sp. 7 TaxID=1658665 RepID=UPI0007DDCC6C|nr:ATP-binding protein [Mitsuaria sp. 7]ANH69202.1 hypothetical protein ABE85_19455 [Mitsuaria sp. 7]
MIKIRRIEIENYRAIKKLDWCPGEGINCLIGPGDSGKSSILDAIELCLSTRRTSVGDSDFHFLDCDSPIVISLTIGDLDEELRNLEDYGSFLRGFSLASGTINDEPALGWETVLTLRVTIERDLEPTWTLYSERASLQGFTKFLSSRERTRILTTRLASAADDLNLSWSRYSILQRFTEEKIGFGAQLRDSAREARRVFGNVEEQLSSAVGVVKRTAQQLGVPTGEPKAMLDLQSLNFKDAAIAFHDQHGVPLRCLGTGSRRLLLAGLQGAEAEARTAVLLVDEVEHGLEPHRVTRLLNALGSRDVGPSTQVFMTTHSTIALQQLHGDQIYVVRRGFFDHPVLKAGRSEDVQSTLRKSPSSFLANKVIVCEGSSELGLLRGVDEYRLQQGKPSLLAAGVAYCDAGGGSPKDCFKKAELFARLGYDVALFIDHDIPISPDLTADLEKLGGKLFTWQQFNALEDALFNNLSDERVLELLELAEDFAGQATVDSKIRSVDGDGYTLENMKAAGAFTGFSDELRSVLGKAAKTRKEKSGQTPKKSGWFKSIERMEVIGERLVGPSMDDGDDDLTRVVKGIFDWSHHGG